MIKINKDHLSEIKKYKKILQDHLLQEFGIKYEPLSYDDLLSQGELVGCLERENKSVHLTDTGMDFLNPMSNSLDNLSEELITDITGVRYKTYAQKEFINTFLKNMFNKSLSPLYRKIVEDNLETMVSIMNELKITMHAVVFMMGCYITKEMITYES